MQTNDGIPLGEVNVFTETDDAGSTLDTAVVLGVGVTTVYGTITGNTSGTYDDIYGSDIYRFGLTNTTTLTIDLSSDNSDGGFDANLILFNANGQGLQGDDDGGDGLNSQITITLEAGDYFIAVGPNNIGAFETSIDFESGNYFFSNDDSGGQCPTDEIVGLVGWEGGMDSDSENGSYVLSFSAPVISELLYNARTDLPWSPAFGEAVGVRASGDNGTAILLEDENAVTTVYYEQTFDNDGQTVGRLQQIEVSDAETAYLQDVNGDGLIDLTAVDLLRDYVHAVTSLTLDGEMVQVTFDQAESLLAGCDNVLVPIDGFGTVVLSGDVETGAEYLFMTDLEVDIVAADGAIISVTQTEKGTYVKTFGSIQSAIDDEGTGNGTAIFVGEGIYAESLTLAKALNFIGAGAGKTIVSPVSGSGLLVTSDTNLPEGTISVSGMSFNDSKHSGIQVANGAVLQNLLIAGSSFGENSFNGLRLGGDSTQLELANVEVENSSFVGNGEPQTSSGDGDILFFNYVGDASLTNITVTGVDRGNGPAENGIQFRSDVGELGNVTLNGVRISGEYEKTPLAFYNYDSIDGLSATNVEISATGGWGIAANFDSIEEGADFSNLDIDASASGQPIAIQGNGDGQTLVAGLSDAALVGKDGNDRLVTGVADDTMTGGDGDDLFAFLLDEIGNDVIMDFGTGSDRLEFHPELNFNDLVLTEAGGDTVLTSTEFDGSVTLIGVVGLLETDLFLAA